MTIDKLSASGTKTYKRCPKSFRYRYVDRYEMSEEEDNRFIQRGDVVHGVLEEFLKSDSDLSNQDVIHDFLTENCSDEYPSSMADDVDTSLEVASKYIANYVTDVWDVEERWEMDHRGIQLIGYCDLVEDGRIVDWKTGKSEGKELDEKIQAAFYIKLYENEYGELPEQVDFAYLVEGQRSTHNRITDDGDVLWNSRQNKYWEDVEKIISDIQNSSHRDEWEANTPDPCFWCDHKLVCSDYLGSENVTREEIEIGI